MARRTVLPLRRFSTTAKQEICNRCRPAFSTGGRLQPSERRRQRFALMRRQSGIARRSISSCVFMRKSFARLARTLHLESLRAPDPHRCVRRRQRQADAGRRASGRHYYVAQVLIARENVSGAESRIFTAKNELISRTTLTHPLDTLLVNDRDFTRSLSSIARHRASRLYRDMLSSTSIPMTT
jgi:hypothetical protein